MKRWEYQAVPWDHNKMNEAGQQGWEAVGVHVQDVRDTYDTTWQEVWVTMKREILEGPKHG
jgi:hypothetical protein